MGVNTQMFDTFFQSIFGFVLDFIRQIFAALLF